MSSAPTHTSEPAIAALYRYGIKPLLYIGAAAGLFAGFVRKRLGKLKRDSAQEFIYMLNSADTPGTIETYHPGSVIRVESGDAKVGSDLLAGVRTILIGLAGESNAAAGNVEHSTLDKRLCEILGKPDRPLITQSLLSSSFDSFLHN